MQTTNNPQEFKKTLRTTTRVIFQDDALRVEAKKVHNRDSRRWYQLKYYQLINNVWQPFSTFVSNGIVDCLNDIDFEFKTFRIL